MPQPDAKRLDDLVQALNAEVRRLIPPGKPAVTAGQWLGRARAAGADPVWDRALDLAAELAVMTPSLLGVTAFDRLARAMASHAPEHRAAADLLRRSHLRLLRLSGRHCEDLATGAHPPFPREGTGVLFGRFAELADGQVVPAGPLLTLDAEALRIAQGFIRPGGKGLGNAARCAEAVFRHVVMQAALSVAVRPAFDPEHNRIDQLAARWASLGRDPNEAEIARARTFAAVGTLLDTLVSVSVASDRGMTALATAYRWIAAIMVETIALRGANGSARLNLDVVAAELAAGDFPPEARALFDTLRAGVRHARASSGATSDKAPTDLDKLVQRIQGLRAKTVEQGCTEQEALAAAEKVAELLDRYGLSLSELDLRQQACEGIGVETGRKRRGPIDDCMTTIAAFFDCRVWAETNPDETLRYVFFGMPADVQASVYLHDLITLAFASETATFQAGPIYRKTPSGVRRSATTSFQAGLAQGIIGKLDALQRARDSAAPQGTTGGGTTGGGRALVPVKESLIDAEMERLGLNLRRRGATRRYVRQDAYGAGQEAGERFEYRPGIERA